ncbi:MAG TPA: hypothetical protein VGR56_05870 [Nitrososphaerales archaeon]|nr:hypothetical protein [Nitrososphaerales archaeon]
METKNILVIGVWAFAIIWLVGMLAVEGDMLSSLIVFFITIAVSVGAIGFPSEKKQVG